MHLTAHDPSEVPSTEGAYVNALEVSGVTRWLFISGQIPQTATGNVPDEAEAQCRQIWRNIQQCLRSAGLGVADLVHVRTYLSDRALASVNTAVRNEVLRGHRPALTVVVAEIFDARWLLEIEAAAAAQ